MFLSQLKPQHIIIFTLKQNSVHMQKALLAGQQTHTNTVYSEELMLDTVSPHLTGRWVVMAMVTGAHLLLPVDSSSSSPADRPTEST